MRKKYLVMCIVCMILNIGVIPANLFLFHLPEWIAIFLGGVSVFILTLFCVRAEAKKISRRLTIFFMGVSILLLFFGVYCNPLWNSVMLRGFSNTKDYDMLMTYDEAKEDLDYMMNYLGKDHPAMRFGIEKEAQAAYDQAIQELEASSEITVTTVLRKMQNILSTLEDAHSGAYPEYKELHYLKYVAERKKDGETLTGVNGMSLSELLQEKSDLISYEVESWGIHQLRKRLLSLEMLTFLGFDLNQGVTFEYTDSSGNARKYTYFPEDFVTMEEYDRLNGTNFNNGSQTSDRFVSYQIDEENSLAIMTLNSCTYNEEYRRCLKEMFQKVSELGLQNVAVDIRDNGGGNSKVVDEFIRYLDVDEYQTDVEHARLGFLTIPICKDRKVNKRYNDLLFHGNVYLLTSAGSFSSAMMFAEYVKANHLGDIIGEAPGNVPDGYGDAPSFQAPNSKLLFQISFSTFDRADRDSTTRLIEPDIPCDSTDAMDVLYACVQGEAAPAVNEAAGK